MTADKDPCITHADLDAAVALALEGAAASARGHAKFTQEAMAKAPAQHIMSNLVQVTQSRTAYAIEDAILALIQPHQADALARRDRETHNAAIEAAAEVVDPPDEDCGCDECHTRAKSAMHIRALALPVEGGAKR